MITDFSKDKLSVKIFDFLLPVIYGIAFYSWIIISEKILHNLKCPNYVPYLFFLPVVVMEIWTTYYLLPKEKILKFKKDLKIFLANITFYRFLAKLFLTVIGVLIFAFRHLLFQYLFFFLWVIYPLHPDISGFEWMSSHSPYVLPSLWLFPYARPFNSLIILILAALLYFFLWVKRRAGRIFFSISFFIIFLAVSYILFYFDAAGGQSKEEVIKQPGVSIILPYGNFYCGERLPRYPARYILPFRFPRCLQGDWEKARLYVSFGSIWGHPLHCPHLIACDLDGRNLQAFLFSGRQVEPWQKTFREFQLEPQTKDFYISSWSQSFKIYRVDRASLSVLEEIPFDYLKEEFVNYNLFDIVSDEQNNRLFFITGQPPLMAKVNLIEKTTKVMNLTKMGITELGSIIHIMRYDKKLNRIYAIVVTGDKGGLLIEVDPENMALTRMLSLPGIVMVSLELDPENNEILVGMGLKKDIWVIDRETFKIKSSIPIPFPCIRRFDIDNENGFLYVVDYLHGYLYVIRRDSGETVTRYKVGNKPLGMVRNGSTVYVASVLGIIKIDTAGLLAPKPVK